MQTSLSYTTVRKNMIYVKFIRQGVYKMTFPVRQKTQSDRWKKEALFLPRMKAVPYLR